MNVKIPQGINKKYLSVFIIAAVLIIIAVFFSSSVHSEGEQSFYYSKKQEAAIIFSDENPEKNIIPGKSISGVRSNAEGLYSAVLMSEGSSYSLYSVSGGVVKQLESNCSNSFITSFGAEKTVFITSTGSLCTSDGKMIDEAVREFALSPDGNVVIYTKLQENTEKLYLYADGNSVFVADNFFPLGVSDDGLFLYVLGADNSLCILNPDGTMKSKLCSDVNSEKFYFSKNMKNIVFSDAQYTYISQEGKSRSRLVSGSASPLFQYETEYVSNSYGNGFICKDSDMFELFYTAMNDDGSYAVYYIKNDSIKTDVSSNVKKFVVTGSHSIAYIDSQGKVSRFHNDKNELIKSGAIDIVATKDNKYVYYLDSLHDLYVVKGKKIEKLSEKAEKIYVTRNDKVLFITTDNELYYVSGKRVGKMIDTDVYNCKCRNDSVFYSKNFRNETGTFDLYCSQNGKRFRFVDSELTK